MADPTLSTVEAAFVTEIEKYSSVSKASFDPLGRGNFTHCYIEFVWGASLASDARNNLTDDRMSLTMLVYGKKRADVTNCLQDLLTLWDSLAAGTKYAALITGGILWGKYDTMTPPLPGEQGGYFIGISEHTVALRYTKQ